MLTGLSSLPEFLIVMTKNSRGRKLLPSSLISRELLRGLAVPLWLPACSGYNPDHSALHLFRGSVRYGHIQPGLTDQRIALGDLNDLAEL